MTARRVKHPPCIIDTREPPDPRRVREMELFDRLPAPVRRVIHEEGVTAMREYLQGDLHRFANMKDGSEYDDFEEIS